MHVQKDTTNRISIVISDDERYLIKQCLNECCHGFRIADFVSTIGASKAVVSRLLDQLGDAQDTVEIADDLLQISRVGNDEVRVSLTPEQGRIFVNCMHETERVLGPKEFPSRFGAKMDEVKQLFSMIEAHLS
jgi:hypothetical protein